MNRLIDRWTLVHLAFWFVVGANFNLWGLDNEVAQWSIVVGGAVVWELVEMTLEKYVWKTPAEKFWDRWVSDILAAIAGAAAGLHWVY